jgi:hypothetical protein
VDDFQALMHSLGEHAVDYIGKDSLRRLDVFGDEADGAAYIEICLEENSWDERSRAIDKMLEIREMFLDEVSIEYRFIDEDSSTVEAAVARGPAFCMA